MDLPRQPPGIDAKDRRNIEDMRWRNSALKPLADHFLRVFKRLADLFIELVNRVVLTPAHIGRQFEEPGERYFGYFVGRFHCHSRTMGGFLVVVISVELDKDDIGNVVFPFIDTY